MGITSYHLLANILHPKFHGERLSAKQRTEAETALIELHPELITIYMKFLAQEDPFPPNRFSDTAKSVPPIVWWKSLRGLNIEPEFIDFVCGLISAPASSASLERYFSTFGMVHSKLRNRLGVATAEKLAMCYRLLKGNQKNEDF